MSHHILLKTNSRLGANKFPFSPATGIGRQRLDIAHGFCAAGAPVIGKSKKFAVIFPLNGNLLDVLTGAAAAAKLRGLKNWEGPDETEHGTHSDDACRQPAAAAGFVGDDPGEGAG